MTYFSDLRTLPAGVIDEARPWIDFYTRHRDLLTEVVYPLLDDPIGKGWTALQSWDPDAGRGALLAFRQDSDATSARIALRNVPPGRRFDLFRAPDDRYARTVSSAQLSRGIDVRLAGKRDARVLLILPAGRPRISLRLRCADRLVSARAIVRSGEAPTARVRFRAGRGRWMSDNSAPFRRVLAARPRVSVQVRATLRDGRRLATQRRAPACAAPTAAPEPRLTG
jgi:hypothetical protein